MPRSPAELDNVCSWALLAQWNAPRLAEADSAGALSARGQSDGIAQLLNWASGQASESPLTRTRVPGRPSLYQLSLDAMHAMASLEESRNNGALAIAGRMEGIIETFAWFAGWEPAPPVDRHGHLAGHDCAERDVPCICDSLPVCARTDCPACWRTMCIHGFGQNVIS
jgi:hypothetical protein